MYFRHFLCAILHNGRFTNHKMVTMMTMMEYSRK